MNLRRLKHTLLRLSAQEKVIGLSAIIMIIGAFMPWYHVVMNFDEKTMTQTALTGDLGVIGFVVLIMSILSLLVMVGENLRLPLPRFGHKRESILFFLLGQSVFLTLLIIAVYTKRSLDFTEAGLRFGSYMVLVGGFFGAFSAFSLIQKTRENEVKAFFGEEMEPIEEAEDNPISAEENIVQEEVFLEDTNSNLTDEIDRVFEEETRKVHEQNRETNHENPSHQPKQGNYFTREAGLQDEKSSEKKNLSMNFYEDN